MDVSLSRLLSLLELLQVYRQLTAEEMASRLEVSPRTVRRYIAGLQDMGIPVETERGPAGGYRLRRGFKLPPLMLSNEEALVVIIGLLAAMAIPAFEKVRKNAELKTCYNIERAISSAALSSAVSFLRRSPR